MEVLSSKLALDYENRKIAYHPKGESLMITHISFVDDLMILFDGSSNSLQGIIDSLDSFHSLSGLVMNREKTSLFVAGVNNNEVAALARFRFHQGKFPVRYLGLPLVSRKLQSRDYRPLIDGIKRKFTGWAERFLSFSGRLQLISTIIFSTINFWMSTFPIPRSCIKIIEQLCNRFLWNGTIVKKAGIKVAWSKVFLPKSEGGLGIRDMRTWNRVLLLRLIWLQFASSGSLWVAWLRNHYYPSQSFWDSDIPSHSSWVWKLLHKLKTQARDFISCKLGNGLDAFFWHDNWCRLGPLISLFGNDGPRHLGIPRNASVSQVFPRGHWLLRPARSEMAESLQIELTSVNPPSASSAKDTYLWDIPHRNKPHDFFSSSETWKFLRPYAPTQHWARIVWFAGHTPRHAFYFWVTNLDRLPLLSRLKEWGLNVTDLCPLCRTATETREHIFLSCSYTARLWKEVMVRLGEPSVSFASWDSLMDWLSVSGRRSKLLKRLSAQALIYLFWKERNARIHTSQENSVSALFIKIDRGLRDKFLANQGRKSFRNLFSQWVSASI